MRKLTMSPERVFYYFEEISKIPRGSGNTKAVSDYCVFVATELGLKVIQDSLNNVVIFKPGTIGREKEEPLIIQGHLDMVCEKNLDCDHDFLKEGLNLCVEDDLVFADRTTLGGDDGIAIAYAMAILESKDISHPPIEAVFTVDEEIGMFGAKDLDTSVLKGKRLLNIDSEEEGVLLTSCAGGLRCVCNLPVNYMDTKDQTALNVVISGLNGGHSGADINKGRCNANKLMGRLLFELGQNCDFSLSMLEGGLQDNAIPRESSAVLIIEEDEKESVIAGLQKSLQTVKEELGSKEENLTISIKSCPCPKQMLTQSSKELVLFLLMQMPNGVQEMSGEIEGLVETSLNVGIMKLDEAQFSLKIALRSSVKTAKYALRDKVIYLTEFLGGECIADGDYPAWEFKRNSHLRETCIQAYKETYGKEPEVMALHAGLECGILAEKIPEFDAISMGPDIYDIHTPAERMSISSVERTWTFIKKILELI